LSNYVTAIGFGSEEAERRALFEKFWPALHLVGKDILRFHAVYWPAFLIAGGVEVPVGVFAHGMWLDGSGRRMSKTLGNTIDLNVLRRHFSNDTIRYYCLREMVFGQDGRFSYEGLIDRANSDLASGLGNLAARTLTMIQRYSAGRIPAGALREEHYLQAKRLGLDADPLALLSMLEHTRDQFVASFDAFAFSRALESAWALIARIDKMISDAKPWELAKQADQTEILETVLYRAAESLRWLGVLLSPVMPTAARSIFQQLGLDQDPAVIDPATLKWGQLPEGTLIGAVEAIFPRIDKKRVMSEIEAERNESKVPATDSSSVAGNKSDSTTPHPPVIAASEAHGGTTSMGREENANVVSFIDIEDFAKVDLRVGEILTAERVPKADKLLRLTIDIGEGQPRQVLAGIAQYYEPEKMVGRKVVVVANLKPRKLRGMESQGMVVAASVGDDGRPVIATFTEDVPNGARLK
jgi:methionyl-tRNA synthetase